MHEVAMRRRLAALVIAALLAMLVVGGAMLFGMRKPAQSQETPPPCNTNFCLDKTATPSTVTVGDQITFTITERCVSPGCGNSNPLVDTLPSGLSIDSVDANDPANPGYQCTTSGNTTVTCSGTRSFTPTQPFTLTIVATTTECGSFTNTASNVLDADGAEATFTVVQCPPPTKEECKNRGWSDPEFAFPNQGTCVSAVTQNRP
jgi:uncharacterized repeat protein (TIGR01451 family)